MRTFYYKKVLKKTDVKNPYRACVFGSGSRWLKLKSDPQKRRSQKMYCFEVLEEAFEG
jgi:hypothetical protein